MLLLLVLLLHLRRLVMFWRNLHDLWRGLGSASVANMWLRHCRWLWQWSTLRGQRRRWWRWCCCLLRWFQIACGGIGDAIVAYTGQKFSILRDVIVANAAHAAQICIVVGVAMGVLWILLMLLLMFLLLLLLVDCLWRRRQQLIVFAEMQQTAGTAGCDAGYGGALNAAHCDAHNGAGGGRP